MKKFERVKDNLLFNQIIKTGKQYKNKYYFIKTLNSDSYNYKVGIAVSKKLGKANYRNYLKRITRNICDNNRFLFKNNTYYIIILNRPCIGEKYEVLNSEFIKLMNSIGDKTNE